jgi:hypothetical protein
MRWVFALSLVLGMLALIGRVMLEGARGRGSDQRRSIMARQAGAAGVAFGMGGLSAAYAGWKLGLATVAAVVAAALAAWYAGMTGSPGGEGSD